MFNVLDDKWIVAVDKNGRKEKFSIRGLLSQAEKLDCITDSSPLIEFGLYRFLFTFLMDAYRPKTVMDVRKILAKGSFDIDVIEQYINDCTEEGITFDIFDKERPFLSEKVPSETCLKSVAVLNPIIPTATSRTFFDHGLDEVREMRREEIARALPSITLFPRGGAGYKSCIAGEGLVFNVVAGDNLFETLAMGMIPERITALEYGLPYWRTNGFKTGEVRAATSFLFGLSFPIRQISFLGDEDVIQVIHFSKGLNYVDEIKSIWRDPYVAYIRDKEGTLHAMRASQDASTGSLVGQWRNIATIAKKGDGIKPLEIAEKVKKRVNVISYAIYVNNAIQDVQRSEYMLPIDTYSDESKNQSLQEAVEFCEEVARKLRSAMHSAVNEGKTSVADSLIRDFISRYYSNCEVIFDDQVTGETDGQKWIQEVGNVAREVYEDFVERCCTSSAERMKKAVEKMNALYNWLRKKGWKYVSGN